MQAFSKLHILILLVAGRNSFMFHSRVHLPIRFPREEGEGDDDDEPTPDGRLGERLAVRLGQQLVDESDEKDGQQRGDGREDGRGKADEGEV